MQNEQSDELLLQAFEADKSGAPVHEAAFSKLARRKML
jgi:hypothetical protein